ncbi:MAG: HXXEE domain-containing protein, partial [Paludibacteraceae bacterium]|nr:HXXEE domain-containing protein [Paludibacteraceae bacterium]
AIKDLNQVKYTIVILEQLLFLVIAVIMAVYSDPMPMCALFWGFAIHTVLQHFFLSVLFRSYYPGLISSVLLLPYFAYGIYNLLNMYSIVENIVMAICGLGVIVLNLALMYWLMKMFVDL